MDFETTVLEIVRTAMHGKNTEPGWVTAYQVLNRLPPGLRAEVVREHGGKGGRENDADRGTGAANAIMRVLRDHRSVEISYFDAWNDAKFAIGEDDWVHPGNVTCAVYRWRPDGGG